MAHTRKKRFDLGVFQSIDADLKLQRNFVTSLVMRLFPADRWAMVSHHHSHATLGLFEAHRAAAAAGLHHDVAGRDFLAARGPPTHGGPRGRMRRPVILSFDGGGDDGTTTAFAGDVDGGDPWERVRAFLGTKCSI